MELKTEYINELKAKLPKESGSRLNIPQREELSKEKISNLVKAKGYKSIISKKALEFFMNRSFSYELKNGDLFIVKVDEVKKTSRSIDVITSNCLIYSFKTKGGTIYATKKQSGNYFCWTAHFFDRYIARTKLNMTRKEAIKHYFKTYLMNGSICDIDKLDKGVFRQINKEGVDLAEIHSFDETSSLDIVLFKTFIDNSMLNSEQLRAFKKSILDVKQNIDLPGMQNEKKLLKRLMEDDEFQELLKIK